MSPTYHNFKKLEHWTNVEPGDMVHSPGTIAFMAHEFAERNINTRIITLAHGLLLVISKVIGVPGEDEDERYVTYTVCSRHGLLVIVKSTK